MAPKQENVEDFDRLVKSLAADAAIPNSNFDKRGLHPRG